jgi:uncharacterized protein
LAILEDKNCFFTIWASILSGYNWRMTPVSYPPSPTIFLAFSGPNRICKGTLEEVRLAVKKAVDDPVGALLPTPLIFNATSGELIDIDLELPILDVHDTAPINPGPGRPRLGVVAREVTLLPRHWEWLKLQPGGASVALRKLVEAARKDSSGVDEARIAQAALYRFMSSMAGNLEGFEDASRALFANDKVRFDQRIAKWPVDIVAHLNTMATPAFTLR